MKLVNTKGILPDGRKYYMVFKTSFSRSLQKTHLFLGVKGEDENEGYFLVDMCFSVFFDPKTEKYVDALREVLTKAENHYGIELMKGELKVVA